MKPCRNCGSIGANIGCDTCGQPLRKRTAEGPSDATACSPSDTPETDAMASMRRTITEWKEHSEKLERERLALAMLAADTPQFFNPMSAIHAKNLRDRLLSENDQVEARRK